MANFNLEELQQLFNTEQLSRIVEQRMAPLQKENCQLRDNLEEMKRTDGLIINGVNLNGN